MSITKPYTFTAGTKARANEVNANFDTLYSQVNVNTSLIDQNANDIDELDSTKADINGNSTQRFAVADAVTNSDAINKQTMNKYIGNSIDLISGLIISKDSGNPNKAILVDAGAAYDSDREVVLRLTSVTSKTNSNQGANATYYVHIIGDNTGNQTDILISSSSIDPALPEGYTRYRNIGYYTTNSAGNIQTIYGYSNSINIEQVYGMFPKYSAAIGISMPYTATGYGYIYAGVNGIDWIHKVYVNNQPVVGESGYSGGKAVYGGGLFPVSPGDYVRTDGNMDAYRFYPINS